MTDIIPEDDDQEEKHIVTCVRCEKKFEGFAPEQAYECASDVHDTMVVGHFGSAVADMRQYNFRDGKRPDDLEKGQICDPCITALIDEGVLKKESASNVGTYEHQHPSPETLVLLEGLGFDLDDK